MNMGAIKYIRIMRIIQRFAKTAFNETYDKKTASDKVDYRFFQIQLNRIIVQLKKMKFINFCFYFIYDFIAGYKSREVDQLHHDRRRRESSASSGSEEKRQNLLKGQNSGTNKDYRDSRVDRKRMMENKGDETGR